MLKCDFRQGLSCFKIESDRYKKPSLIKQKTTLDSVVREYLKYYNNISHWPQDKICLFFLDYGDIKVMQCHYKIEVWKKIRMVIVVNKKPET